MPRGPRKFLKRVYAPKHWLLDKLSGNFAPKPSAGPHKLRECIPLVVILRNRLKYALNYREVITVVKDKSGNCMIDNKVRKDPHFPAGFMDVVTIVKSKEHFRLLYDMKGRFMLHKIPEAEAKYKLCKIVKKGLGNNGIPYVVTHDGRTIRFPNPDIKLHESIKLNLEDNKVEGVLKLEAGSMVMATGGNNVGRYGVVTKTEKHPASFDIVHVKEANGNVFATRKENLFAIGQGQQSWISLPKGKPYKLNIMEEKAERQLKKERRPEKKHKD
jgi:small subunit ribosomal protein S4e